MAPPIPTSPATVPTARFGKRSVGRVMMSVDHHWWPKRARLKRTMHHETETCGTNMIKGMIMTTSARGIFRARFSERPRWNSQLEKPPPSKQPIPPAAYGIQAKIGRASCWEREQNAVGVGAVREEREER